MYIIACKRERKSWFFALDSKYLKLRYFARWYYCTCLRQFIICKYINIILWSSTQVSLKSSFWTKEERNIWYINIKLIAPVRSPHTTSCRRCKQVRRATWCAVRRARRENAVLSRLLCLFVRSLPGPHNKREE